MHQISRSVLVPLLVAGMFQMQCAAANPSLPLLPAFPTELVGTWDLGPEACALPLNPDSDSPIRIEPKQLQGYEHQSTPVEVLPMVEQPMSWAITSITDIAYGETTEIYILNGDHLVITDGIRVAQYTRCR